MARLPAAAATLVFVAHAMATGSIASAVCLHGSGAWWVATDLPLDAARDAALACGGVIHVHLNGQLVPDRGWGAPPADGTGPALSSLTGIAVLDLVRRAGISRSGPKETSEAVILLPGAQLGNVVRRALDLELTTSFQRAVLAPLFSEGAARPAYAVTVESTSGHLPAHFLTALERDPFVVVCRRAGEQLLIEYQHASALPDAALAALVDSGTWVLASRANGCCRLEWRGEPQPGAGFVRLDRDIPLTDPPAGDWPDSLPEPPVLSVVPARSRGQRVDAILLSDEDLRSLPALLEGTVLADRAELVLGRDRHLLTAPGGLLEELPVGEPLYCLGPGQLYLPLGYRLKPLLPVSARRARLAAVNGRGIVLTAVSTLVFDLSTGEPAWELWAGPLPEVDPQLPDGARADLARLDAELSPPDSAPRSVQAPRFRVPGFYRPEGRQGQRSRRSLIDLSARTADWREQAYRLEVRGELAEAAEVHLRNNQPLQAARLFERAAELEDR